MPTIRFSKKWGTVYQSKVDLEKVKPLKIVALYQPLTDHLSFIVKEHEEFRRFDYDEEGYLHPLGHIDQSDLQSRLDNGELIPVSTRYGQLGKKLKGFKEDFYVYYPKLK